METFFKKYNVFVKDNLIFLKGTLKKQVSFSQDNKSIFWDQYLKCQNESQYFIGVNEGDKKVDYNSTFLEEHPTMFIEFSELNLSDPKDIKSFISKYGFLTTPLPRTFCTSQRWSFNNEDWEMLESESDQIIYGEPLSIWVLFQIEIRKLIRYWRNFNSFNRDNTFSQINTISKNPLIINDFDKSYFFSYYFRKNNKFINEEQIAPDLPGDLFTDININDYFKKYEGIGSFSEEGKKYKITNNEIINYMQDYLISNLNNLQQIIMPNFLTVLNTPGKKQSLLSSFATGNIKNPGNYILYNSLMGGIVSQLANKVATNKKYKRCMECQSWMEESLQGRSGKKYCHTNCRASASRRRDGIKFLYEFESNPDGYFSLKKQLNEFCKELKNDNYDKWKHQFEELFKDKPKIKALQSSVISNTLNNFVVWASDKSVCEHLDIPPEYIQSPRETNSDLFKILIGNHRFINPYNDWDFK